MKHKKVLSKIKETQKIDKKEQKYNKEVKWHQKVLNWTKRDQKEPKIPKITKRYHKD